MKVIRILIGLLSLILTQLAIAQAPQTLSYQGLLTDTQGNPVANGNVQLTCKLYDTASGGNLLWNGSFELPLTGRPLGWQIRETGAVSVQPVARKGRAGGTALAVAFSGGENLNFAGVQQQFVVQPGATYSFSFEAQRDDLYTDRGPFLELVDPISRQSLHVTDELVGDSPWQEHSSTFTVPPQTSLVAIRLRRIRSRNPESRIAGRLLLDNLTVRQTADDLDNS